MYLLWSQVVVLLLRGFMQSTSSEYVSTSMWCWLYTSTYILAVTAPGNPRFYRLLYQVPHRHADQPPILLFGIRTFCGPPLLRDSQSAKPIRQLSPGRILVPPVVLTTTTLAGSWEVPPDKNLLPSDVVIWQCWENPSHVQELSPQWRGNSPVYYLVLSIAGHRGSKLVDWLIEECFRTGFRAQNIVNVESFNAECNRF